MEKYLFFAGSVFLVLIGLAGFETWIGEADGDILGMIAASVFAGLFVVVGCVGIYGFKDEIDFNFKSVLKEFMSNLFADTEAPSDTTDMEKLLTEFRRDYAEFFNAKGKKENDAIQNEATQIAWNILELQKKRLDRLGVKMDFHAERKQYGDSDPVTSNHLFDGRYAVDEVREEIASVRKFLVENKVRYTRKDTQVAYYTLLSAEKKGEDDIVCPNCGNVTTRENLLDGCDYCSTKFTVEDLGTRVSDFVLRPDFEVQYAKYEQVRARMNAWIYLIVGSVVGLLSTIGMLAVIDGFEDGFFLTIVAAVGSILFLVWAACFLAKYAFWFCVFPLIQIAASSLLWSKRYMKEREQAAKEDNKAEEKARKFDPLFSLAGFYSNVQNKLATIHYADTESEINAFALCDLKGQLARCAKTISLSVEDMKLDGFTIANGMQRAKVTAKVELLDKDGSKIKKRKEHIKLELVKREDCKMKSVSTPALMRCAGCGSSMLILEGKTCGYCGHELDLPAYDWAIETYQVI